MPSATEELSEDGPQRNVAVVDEDGEFGLRDAAAAGIRKIAEEQKSGNERADDGNHHPAPGRAARRIHLRGQPACQQNEGHHHQADQYADNQAEYNRELIFAILELFRPPAKGRAGRGNLHLSQLSGRHGSVEDAILAGAWTSEPKSAPAPSEL